MISQEKDRIECVMDDKEREIIRGIQSKYILDPTCGSRQIWFNKNEPHTIYCDEREGEWEIDVNGRNPYRKHLEVRPDIVCDFTKLPFAESSFYLVIFDPPHVKNLSDKSWFKKEYGSLDDGWETVINRGFHECMRVLKPNGVLIFKWSDVSISTRDVIRAIGEEPLFGHRSGKK